MKFTIELKVFIKMVQQVGKRMPGQKKADADVRLFACAARVFVESNQTIAGTEALVFEDGQCILPRARFLGVLQTYVGKKHLTVEVDAAALRIGNFSMSHSGYRPHAEAPGEFQVFPVSDLSVLLSHKEVPEPQPVIESQPPQPGPDSATTMEEFPIGEREQDLLEAVVRFTRGFCALPQVTPQELAGLAHALFALERLPRVTKGVKVEFRAGFRWLDRHDDYDAWWATFYIDESAFRIGCAIVVGGGHPETETLYEAESSGHTKMGVDNGSGWIEVLEWIEGVGDLLSGSDEILLFVCDDSDPECMSKARGE